MTSRSWPVSLIFAIGLVFLFVGERIVEGPSRMAMSGLGALIVVFSLGLRLVRSRQAAAERAAVEKSFLALQGIAVAALLLYVVQSDLWAKIASATLETDSPKLAGALAALWPALIAVVVPPLVLMEVGYLAMTRAPKVELLRMREAMYSGLGLGFTLVFAVAAQYVASERDHRADFSYFRTSKPGDT